MKHPELCRSYMRGQPCEEPCKYKHVEKHERPYCDEWFATADCPYEDRCFYPHVYPKHLRERRDASFALQIPHSMTWRVRDYVMDSVPRMEFAPDVVLHGIHDTRGHGFTKKQQRVLLVNATGPQAQIDEVISTLGNSPVLRNALSRGYVVQHITDEWDEVLDYAKANLREAGLAQCGGLASAMGKLQVCYRTQCYPHSLEEKLAKALDRVVEEAEVDGVVHQLEYVPRMKGWERMIYLVYVDGYYYCGISVPNGPAQWGHIASKNVIENAICRAQYKLSEAMVRTGVFQVPYEHKQPCFLESRGIITPKGPAIDIGASPGGWSVFLSSRGYSPVYAVDPGQLRISPEQHKSIIHLRMLGNEAIELLKRRYSQGSGDQVHSTPILGETKELESSSLPRDDAVIGRLQAYACDANVSTLATVNIFKECIPLLVPRAPVVITLKNFDGPKGVWREKVQKAKHALDQYCDRGHLIHLMSNGDAEITYIGWLKEPVVSVSV